MNVGIVNEASEELFLSVLWKQTSPVGNNWKKLLWKGSTIPLFSSWSPDCWGGLRFDEKNTEGGKWERAEVAPSSEEKKWILAVRFKITPTLWKFPGCRGWKKSEVFELCFQHFSELCGKPTLKKCERLCRFVHSTASVPAQTRTGALRQTLHKCGKEQR